MNETFNTYTLENGLRIIQISSPTNVAYCGISIDAGTRDELDDEHGMAHFCEHMMFKGTEKRRSWHIINRMEAVGGDLNAYTNKEETVVYAAFLKDNLARAIELMGDIVFHSNFPQNEIDKESEVIIDEIESYNDTPSDLIFDKFENIIYEGSSLGHDILGTSEDVRRFKSEDAKRFVKRLYRPDKMVLFVFGDVNFKYVVRLANKYLNEKSNDDISNINGSSAARIFNKLSNSTLTEDNNISEDIVNEPEIALNDFQITKEYILPSPPLCASAGKTIVVNHGTHQAHVMIGCPAYSSDDKCRIALYLLNNIIGGPGMNSRLNVALREHNGLVYTVESSLTNYTDTSTFAIYFGCDEEDIDKCLKIVRKELDKLMSAPLTENQFKAIMKQIEGQIGVACDNFENYSLDMAKCFLHYNRFEGMNDTISHLHELNPQILQQVAKDILAKDRLVTLIFK
ncbi:MAG: insulinase family protein [Bacteroidaceae bacterium]|nr:insulinase family protein [Bacteroidaceae bacterium]